MVISLLLAGVGIILATFLTDICFELQVSTPLMLRPPHSTFPAPHPPKHPSVPQPGLPCTHAGPANHAWMPAPPAYAPMPTPPHGHTRRR